MDREGMNVLTVRGRSLDASRQLTRSVWQNNVDG
jgi:hypothetical protein